MVDGGAQNGNADTHTHKQKHTQTHKNAVTKSRDKKQGQLPQPDGKESRPWMASPYLAEKGLLALKNILYTGGKKHKFG